MKIKDPQFHFRRLDFINLLLILRIYAKRTVHDSHQGLKSNYIQHFPNIYIMNDNINIIIMIMIILFIGNV